ncbi:MAG: rRNA pseudouridine synthase [Clostridia bacterium]|nr:rRNA pseudouridine synthase [Clostridia bacterium]
MAEPVRLQKFMAECGVASRRASEELINKGRVVVNGKKAKVGDKVDPKKDVILVDGERIRIEEELYYIMLNKPRGFISTMKDEQGRKCVAQLVEDVPARVFPVGRLDKDSEGLLLFTNDGEFANNMTHPTRHVSKLYRVTVKQRVTEDMINTMMTGMVIDGKQTLPADVRVLVQEPNRTVLEISICEGRNRQIRKMCEGLGLEVARLKRIAIGPVKLGMLKQGDWRELKPSEVKALKRSVKTRQ